MKKFFDRYLFSRMGLQMLFSVLAILAFSVILSIMRNCAVSQTEPDSYSNLTWGFRQLADGGSVTQTLEGLDQIKSQKGNVPLIFALAILSWMGGMILCGFVTGAIVNAFDGRKDKIRSGQVRYKFKGHGLIIGWDYQGSAVVKNLLSRPEIKELLIVSQTPAEEITDILSRTFDKTQMANIYIYNSTVKIGDNISELQPEAARVIVILGEQNSPDQDGESLQTERILQNYVRQKIRNSPGQKFDNLPIKLYLHLEDPSLYIQARSDEDGFIEDELIDIELCNFYESWAWRCWSCTGALDSTSTASGKEYLPLRYKNSERVELFVIGFDPMAMALINYAIPLMNYGKTGKHCKITLFDENSESRIYLPKKQLTEMLPEVDIVYAPYHGSSDEANDIMYEAACREDTSVTVVIALPGADAAVKAYAALSRPLRREKISVLIRQSTECASCITKELLQNSGDNVELRYFGMLDILPWMDLRRDEYGKYNNYGWEVVNKIISQKNDWKPVEAPEKFLEILNLALAVPFGEAEAEQAEKQWNGIQRWKRWSSINAGDSFKEKMNAFPDCTSDAERCVTFLRSEHNRWWSERLLAGWVYCQQRDDKQFRHPALAAFETLEAKTQAIDLLCLIAMKNAKIK